MDYYEGLNAELLSMLPKEAKIAVEVGCGAGRLASAYRTINPTVNYFGVEIFEEAAQQASNYMDGILIGNIEDDDVFFEMEDMLEDKPIDLLIFGDVLEHLIDPWTLLGKFKEIMLPKGHCVACIPNISHWTVLAGLIRGEWNYQDFGLLDKTHLRFFTKKTMIELFENTGWQIEALTPRIFALVDETENAMKVLTPLAPSFGLTSEQMKENLTVFQWVIRARCT